MTLRGLGRKPEAPRSEISAETRIPFAPEARAAFRVLAWIAVCLGVGGTLQPAFAELVSERITQENFASRRVGGPDSIAGVGDWFLSNGTICAAISNPDHRNTIAPEGGVLIDLGRCGANNDQWTLLQPTLNLSDTRFVPVSKIEVGTDTQRAWLRARGVVLGVEVVTTYTLDLATPTVLSYVIKTRRIEAGKRLSSVGSILLHPSGQTPVFSLLRRDLERSLGFVYPASSRSSSLSLLKALAATDLTILVGGDEMPPISYGVEHVSSVLSANGKLEPLASFNVTGEHFTLLNSLTRPLWFGGGIEPPGLMRLMQMLFMDVEAESVGTTRFRIWVGQRADVASITDQIWQNAAEIRGTIDDASARIHIDLASGAPVSEVRPNEDGTFAIRLPTGRYRARAIDSAERTTSLDFEVIENQKVQWLPRIETTAFGWVRLPVDFIGRLVFLNEDGSGPAVFGRHHLGLRIGDDFVPSGVEAPFINLAASPSDPLRVRLKPGRYRVAAVRGPEYEAAEVAISVHSGRETQLGLRPLMRVAETPGWISADLHVHSGESFDSNLPQVQQIIAFAASGAEVLVATEHDRVFDPGIAIRESGLAHLLVSITGVETTSALGGGDIAYTSAHLNVFPVEPLPGQFRGGAPSLARRRLRDTLFDIHRTSPSAFVQLNHPRPPGPTEDDGGVDTYFSHLGAAAKPFDPTLPLSRYPNSVLVEKSREHEGRDLDYDGVELMNAESLIRYRRARADWFSLLLQGERIVATANSDSHRQGAIVGLPRTYVEVPDDALTSFDEDVFLDSLRAGSVYGSTGPLLTARIGEAGLGELHAGSTGLLVVAVDAAPWVPIREWRAYVNGELVHRAPIAAGGRASLPLAFEHDSYVTLEVEGPAQGLYRDVLPGFTPFAFTNPIFVDVDGNGRFDAPGLPDDLPRTLTDPCRVESASIQTCEASD